MIHDLDGSGPLSDLRNERKIAKWTIVREDGIKIWSFKFGQDDGALPGRTKMTSGEGLFTIFVRMGARIGRDDLTKDAGVGSRMQDLLGAEETRETISSSDNSLNWWKVFFEFDV